MSENQPAEREQTSPEITDWRAGLPDDIRGDASLANFKDVGQLAKSFIETKAYQGRSIHLPPEDANEDQRREFTDALISKVPGLMYKPDMEGEAADDLFMTLGMPREAKDYAMPDKIDTFPEGAYDPERFGFLKDMARNAKLTKAQFEALTKQMLEAEGQSISEQIEAHNQSVKELRGEWGAAYEDRYHRALQAAEALARKTGYSGDVEAIKNGQAGPSTLKQYAAIADMLGSEGNAMSRDQGSNAPMTPAEAREALAVIMKNKEHPYHKKAWDQEKQDAVNRVLKLQELANPGASTNLGDLRASA